MWFAIIDSENNIVSNHIGDHPPAELDSGLRAIPSEFPAPNPYNNAIDISGGIPVVIKRKPSEHEQRESAKRDIDRAAGRARARYVTVTQMQSLSYNNKYEEARRFMADPTASVTAETFPYLYRRSQRGIDPVQEASAIIQKAGELMALDAVIEDARLAGKAEIDAAVPDAIETIAAAVISGLDAI